MPTLPVSHSCLWYPDIPGQHEEPHAATVTRSAADGLLCLTIWPPNANTPMLRRGVRYVHDPILKLKPQLARDSMSGCGVWDYAPEIEEHKSNGQPKEEPCCMTDEEILDAAHGLRKQKVTWPEIEKRVSKAARKKLPWQTIQKMFRDAGRDPESSE